MSERRGRPAEPDGGASTMRVVIYARYSSENQREASIQDQLRICKDRIAREDWDLVQVFQDRALSGASTLRPGYQALLAGAREGAFDVVLAEALDRLSRDQEDVAALYKRLRFAGIRVVTLAEGEISELHVGLKGTMNALFLRDLAAKTHRGLRGRIEAGRSGGGNAYGYAVVHRLGPDGQPLTGEREIDPVQGTVVTRIFRDYADGLSPKRIALNLNAEATLGPRGGAWSPSTINGNSARGTGILNNELYIGRLIWNRLSYAKDPDTGRRRSRPHAAAEQVVTEVPELRIINDPLWQAVKARQASVRHDPNEGELSTATGAAVPSRPYWSKQRPRYLFSGLMHCGVCGGGFSKISAVHFGCSTARNKGATACTNLRTIRRNELEDRALHTLRARLMDPTLYKAFSEEFVAEWNRSQGDAAAGRAARDAELQRVRQQIERLVDAIVNGTPAVAVNARLQQLEARRLQLEAELSQALPEVLRLHPALPEIYRAKVKDLVSALDGDDAATARELVRGLVEHITLHPEADGYRVEVRGELAAILALCGTGVSSNSASGTLSGGTNNKAACVSAAALSVQIKMVAGTGFEPVTFRL
ncbi:MAG: recombinase family protein [Janthinobacterium lividum]